MQSEAHADARPGASRKGAWRTVKQAIKRAAPSSLHPPAMAARYLRHLMTSDRVVDGPFAGMLFTWEAWDEHFTMPTPKFLGTYELELHSVVEAVCRLTPDLVIDVGAADGFYAVGFALRIPRAQVVAFEELAKGRALVERIALANHVADRVRSLGRCEVTDLSQALGGGGRAFVMLDIEGHEGVLLDPALIPQLKTAHILVEAHDCYAPGVSQLIRSRFAQTHRIESIPSRGRSLADIKSVNWLRKHYSKYSMVGWLGERLYAVEWLYLTPNA